MVVIIRIGGGDNGRMVVAQCMVVVVVWDWW